MILFCINWYKNFSSTWYGKNYQGEWNYCVEEERGVQALWDALWAHQQSTKCRLQEIDDIKTMEVISSKIVLMISSRLGRGLLSWSINKNFHNFNDIQYFDDTSYKEDFIDWILDLKDYSAYAKISKYFKVQFVSRKLMWCKRLVEWNKIFRRRRGTQDFLIAKNEKIGGFFFLPK